jgi:acyl-CoA reductase-like NAD-dependent aldehyde dehydrogenase
VSVAETAFASTPPVSASVRRFLDNELGMVIDDDVRRPSSSGTSIEVVDPATEQVISTVPAGVAVDADAAVASCQQAFEDRRWTGLHPAERAELMWRLADLIDRDRVALSELETLDVGTPISQTVNSPAAAARTLRYYAGWCTKIYGNVNPVGDSYLSYTDREPVGVVAGIGAWNSPLVIAASKSGPALAAGNPIVLKPAEQAPLSTIWFARLALEAGIPPGVLNVVTGIGSIVGPPLVENRDVALVTFTGSVPVGQDIHRRANRWLTDTVLELGGKSPNIVFADADLDRAAAATVRQMSSNAAQVCYTGSRVLVDTSVRDEFVARVIAGLADLTMGPGLLPATQLGPVVSERQRDRVEGYLEVATSEGAEFAFGGERHEGVGYYVPPALVTGVRNDMRLAREEIFGPIIGVLDFEDEAEAVMLANDTDYGLAAGIWTRDVSRAHRVARQVHAGTVWVNTYGVLDRSAPSGGFRLSGIGREHGDAWIHHFTGDKTVYVGLGT